MLSLEQTYFACRLYFLRRRVVCKLLSKAAGLFLVLFICAVLYSHLNNEKVNTEYSLYNVSSANIEPLNVRVVVQKNFPRLMSEMRRPPSDVSSFCQDVHSSAFESTHADAIDVLEKLQAYNCSAYRRDAIVEMTKFAWDGYAKFAWGENEVRPDTRTPHRMSVLGDRRLGMTIVDGLDTLFLMGLSDRFERGRNWVEKDFHVNRVTGTLSVFETAIRFIGGLLSCYALTNDLMFIEKATEVAEVLLPAFNTTTGIPYALIDVEKKTGKNWPWAPSGSSILAEFGTLHLEFEYLSFVTGNPVYLEKVTRIRQFLNSTSKPDGLYSNYINPSSGAWGTKHVSINGLGDSFYEYLLKSWLISNRRDDFAKSMYDAAIQAIVEKLLRHSKGGLMYFAELKANRYLNKMSHLGCFIGGLFALHAEFDQQANETYKDIAREITRTCHESYIRSAVRLGPESFFFDNDIEAVAKDGNERYYILRPEVIESYFYLWRTTKNPMYQEWAWDAAMAIETYCKSNAGYSGIKDVYAAEVEKDNVQQSYFLSETLKYLFLIFCPDDVLPLDKWVFNTEAHPLPIRFS